MKISLTIIVCIMAAIKCFPNTYEAEMSSIAHDMSTGKVYSARMALTNRIDSLMASVSNELEVASCKLAKATLLLDCAEEELLNSAYVEATNLCASVMIDFSSRPQEWQIYGACYLMASAYFLEGEKDVGLATVTNALAKLDAVPSVSIETNVWQAIISEDRLCDLTLRDTFRAGAALGKALMHDLSDMGVYTNGLPQDIVDVVNEMVE